MNFNSQTGSKTSCRSPSILPAVMTRLSQITPRLWRHPHLSSNSNKFRLAMAGYCHLEIISAKGISWVRCNLWAALRKSTASMAAWQTKPLRCKSVIRKLQWSKSTAICRFHKCLSLQLSLAAGPDSNSKITWGTLTSNMKTYMEMIKPLVRSWYPWNSPARSTNIPKVDPMSAARCVSSSRPTGYIRYAQASRAVWETLSTKSFRRKIWIEAVLVKERSRQLTL